MAAAASLTVKPLSSMSFLALASLAAVMIGRLPPMLPRALADTFASHFMINGGNILTLQRILGHQDLKTTMRYAHLAPEHMEAAKALNPISALVLALPHERGTSGIH